MSADRSGRGKGLTAEQRNEVWQVLLSYGQHLQENQLTDWQGVALRFRDAVAEGQIRFPCYDCILIDEAQFFAKVWFDIVMAALKPSGELFLAADPTQGFLKRGQSWIFSGIDVRGRSRKLNTPYRNSRSILRFAGAFAIARQLDPNKVEEDNLPDHNMLTSSLIEGKPPEIIHCLSLLDSHHRVSNEISQLLKNNHPRGQILILHASSKHLHAFQQTLVQTLGKEQLVHLTRLGPQPRQAFCQLCTLNAATGLEAPIVFLLGMDTLLEKEDSPHLADDERMALRDTHTRKLYMGITRAAQRLVIVTENVETMKWLEELTAPVT